MWLQPAAMDDRTVVSEIGAQWSPKREPLRTAAMVMHCESSKPYAMWIPRGSNIAMVPQEVPVAKEMTDPMRKSIAGTMLAGMITDDEKIKACQLSEEAGAAFVKTSTGFSTGGATKEDVALMKSVVGDRLQVKASGGIRDYQTTMEMIKAGADRIGASASVSIVESENH